MAAQTQNLYRVLFLILLLLATVFVLTWSGIVKCGFLPGWCRLYNSTLSAFGQDTRILIVYGDGGLGTPFPENNLFSAPGTDDPVITTSLQEWLANPDVVGNKPDLMHIDRINLGNLRKYRLIIVERARKVSTAQLRTFMDYVNSGGTLLWTGDAGTELGSTNGVPDAALYYDEKEKDAPHTLIGPWARRQGDEIVAFDEFLGVRYRGTFCQLTRCAPNVPNLVGRIKYDASDKTSLAYGMAPVLPLYVFEQQDFAIVELIQGPTLTEHLYLDSDLPIRADTNSFTTGIPLITTNGASQRVAYYALPPEYYANTRLLAYNNPDRPDLEKGLYKIPLENIYYGLLYGSSKIEKLEWED